MKKTLTGLTDVTEPAAEMKQAPVDPTYRFEPTFRPVLLHRMIRQNRNQRRCSCPERLQNRQTEHRLIRRGKLKAQYTGESKTTTPVKPTMPKHLRRCNTPETLKRKYEQNPDHRLIHWQAPVQPVIRKILPEPRTNFSARHS